MTEAAASGPSGGRVAGFPLRGPLRLLSDERLSRRATSGDRRAFEEIFRRYHQDLYRFCLATVSNPQDAQEALQNTMVKVLRALPGEQREIKLKPWLFRIARNEAIETMRKRRDTVELGSTSIAAPWEIADAAGARARLRELFSDLTELPERQRSALVMRELSGLEFEEIGETLGTSAPVARQTLYEARQSLRQMEEGREMSCASIRKAISDADGRVTRRRDIRAHLRDCVGCSAFRDDIAQRRAGFASLAPLPAAAALGLLQGVLSGEAAGGAALASGAGAAAAGGSAAGGGAAASGGAAAGGGLTGSIGAGAGQAVATSAIVKSVATVAVVTAVGAGAADRGGLIDLPSPRDDGKPTQRAGGPAVAPATEARPESAARHEGRPGNPADRDEGRLGAAAGPHVAGSPSPAARAAGLGMGARQAAKAARRRGGGRPAHPAHGGANAGGRPDHAGRPAGPPDPPASSRAPERPAPGERGAQPTPPGNPPEQPASGGPSLSPPSKPAPPSRSASPKAESTPPAPPAGASPPAAPPASGKGAADSFTAPGAEARPAEDADS